MKWLLTTLLSGVLASAGTQAAHITDKLLAGLYEQPEVAEKAQRLLPSGTPLDVLQRKQGFTEVRLSDDTRGWVESIYVSEEKPAKMKLLESQAKVRQLKAELAGMESGVVTSTTRDAALPGVRETELRQALDKAGARIELLEKKLLLAADNSRAQQQLQQLQGQVSEAVQVLAAVDGLPVQQVAARVEDQDNFSRYRSWVYGGLALVIGFGFGVGFIDYRIRKRYGGFRI